jgi:hypothetical protein
MFFARGALRAERADFVVSLQTNPRDPVPELIGATAAACRQRSTTFTGEIVGRFTSLLAKNSLRTLRAGIGRFRYVEPHTISSRSRNLLFGKWHKSVF